MEQENGKIAIVPALGDFKCLFPPKGGTTNAFCQVNKSPPKRFHLRVALVYCLCHVCIATINPGRKKWLESKRETASEHRLESIFFRAMIAMLALMACAMMLPTAIGEEPENKTKPVNYGRPFEPPTRPAFIPLPPGTIEPAGWLRDWALTAKDGYTGTWMKFIPLSSRLGRPTTK